MGIVVTCNLLVRSGVFFVLTVVGMLLLLAAATGLRETLPLDRRQSGSIRATITTFRQLLASRSFVGYALSCSLAFSAMFSYISGSPFVLQDLYGLSPQLFSVIFGMNVLGLVVVGRDQFIASERNELVPIRPLLLLMP